MCLCSSYVRPEPHAKFSNRTFNGDICKVLQFDLYNSCVNTEEERGSFSSLYLERLRGFDSSKLHMNQ